MKNKNFRLKPNTVSRALEHFALGKTRTQVAECLLTENPIPKEVEELLTNSTQQQVKKTLVEKLRTVDPTSTRFAKSKYEDEYESIQRNVMSAFHAQGQRLVLQRFQNLTENETRMTDLIDTLQQQLLQAQEKQIVPQNNTEYVNTIRVLINMCKAHSQNNNELNQLIDYFGGQKLPF